MNPTQEPPEPKPAPPPNFHNTPMFPAGGMPRVQISENDINAQLSSMQEYYKQQQAVLAFRFEESRRHLQQEQFRMQQDIKIAMEKQQEYMKQQQQALEKARNEEERLARLQNKSKDQESAVASSEVKARLRNMLVKKSIDNLPQATQQYPATWAQTQHRSLEQHSPPSGLSPPPRIHPNPNLLASPTFTDKPLRKAASEPNIRLRLALKQKMMERRSSPLTKRRDRHHPLMKQAISNNLSVSAGSLAQPQNDPDSGPNTPPSSAIADPTDMEGASGTLPLQMMSKLVNISLPNISLAQREALAAGMSGTAGVGLPEDGASGRDAGSSMPLPDAEIRARLAAMYGLPPNSPLLSHTLPFYPIPPLVEGAASNEAAMIAHMRMLEAMAEVAPNPYARAAHAAPGLTRTQSAPLPLPRQLLYQHNLWLQRQQEEMMRQSNPKSYIRQKIQSSILQRAGVKGGTMENVDEEAEARIAQEMQDWKRKEEEEALAMEQQMQETARHQQARQALLQKVTQRSRSHVMSDNVARAKSYPAISNSPPIPENASTTGLAYDSHMLKHMCVCGDEMLHEENPQRLEALYQRLLEAGILARCTSLPGRKATIEEIKSCHSEAYALLYGSNPKKLAESQINPKMFEHLLAKFCQLPCGGVGVDCDTTWNEAHTPTATRYAVGAVVDLALKVWSAELENGFALVRPPGHHAEATQAMGFCYFNNVAIAAKQLLAPPREIKRVLILDWDVHHGNSTQEVFFADSRVLYMSLHRHDDGNFFPGTGAPDEVGIERGRGYTVNVAWSSAEGTAMADAEYLAAFRTVIMPIAREFDPEIVLVSAGFDGAVGHSPKLGGYQISPACFGYMTEQLKDLAGGKLVLALEGGYFLPVVQDCTEICLRVLLGEKVSPVDEKEMLRPPCEDAITTLRSTIDIQAEHWPCVQLHAHTVGYSHAEAQRETMDTLSSSATPLKHGVVGSAVPKVSGSIPPQPIVVAPSRAMDAHSALSRDTHNTCTQFASLSVVKEADGEKESDGEKTEDMES